MNLYNGWLIIDKPKGISSNDAVQKVKRLVGKANKVGHAGTLDPLAEGVLPIAIGEATKTSGYLINADKEYEFDITWGEERSTGDAEGEVTATSNFIPSIDEIKKILPKFIGEITQIPPIYSAIKIAGKPAYKLAREGKEVEVPARQVQIYSLEIIPFPKLSSVQATTITSSPTQATPPTSSPTQAQPEIGDLMKNASKDPRSSLLKQLARDDAVSGALKQLARDYAERSNVTRLKVNCGKGTYVRSLAVDIARALGSCGYVSYLKRVKVGKFLINDAIMLAKLINIVHNTEIKNHLLSVNYGLGDILGLEVNDEQALALRQGRKIILPEFNQTSEILLQIFNNGVLQAIASVSKKLCKPLRVFNLNNNGDVDVDN